MRILYSFLCFFPYFAFAQIDDILLRKWQEQLGVSQEAWLVLEQAPALSLSGSASQHERGKRVFELLQQEAQEQQAGLLSDLRKRGISAQSYYIVNAVFVPSLGQAEAEALLARPEVLRILPNLPIRAHFPLRSAASRNADFGLWGLDHIQAKKLWELGILGQGVTVGGQDTGYDWEHPALQKQYRGRADAHEYHWHDAIHAPHPLHSTADNPCGFSSRQPCDDSQHGTHTMGTIVGADSDTIGVAPQAQWVGCRNMDRGWGSPASYIECFEWFLAPYDAQGQNYRPELAPQVINNSWGCPEIEGCEPSNFELMRLAVQRLRQAGIVVVVSAGNSGPGCETVNSPAAIFDEALSIGATRPEGGLANFSSRGPVAADGSMRLKPDLVAPGQAVWSAVPRGGYSLFSGTSMAGPHVAGLIALLISADPSLAGQVERIEELLKASASPLFGDADCGQFSASAYPNIHAGYGEVNAWRALRLLRPELREEQAEQLSIYPNPSKGPVQLIFPEDMGASTLRIYSAEGKLVFQESYNFVRILQSNFEFLPEGFYIVHIEGQNKKRYTGKWMKIP